MLLALTYDIGVPVPLLPLLWRRRVLTSYALRLFARSMTVETTADLGDTTFDDLVSSGGATISSGGLVVRTVVTGPSNVVSGR
jgi:hypothetical protein